MATNFPWVSVGKAAERIGCTVGRVRQMLRSGQLIGKKINGRAWLVCEKSVDRMRDTSHKKGRPRISQKIPGMTTNAVD